MTDMCSVFSNIELFCYKRAIPLFYSIIWFFFTKTHNAWLFLSMQLLQYRCIVSTYHELNCGPEAVKQGATCTFLLSKISQILPDSNIAMTKSINTVRQRGRMK